jgi:predicted dehydrogenase
VEALRLGVYGAARISERAIVTPAKAAGAQLIAVAARQRARAEAFADQFGVGRVHNSYADLLSDADVEAVYNPLPNGLHGPWNLAAIAAGKHVLSEKPFASNAAEAAEVRDAGSAAGVVVADGFHYVYHPLMNRIHGLLSSGELGALVRVEAVMRGQAPPPDDLRWSYPLAGGAIMDLGCYSLHVSRVLGPWAGGEPTLVSASGEERRGVPGVDEWAAAELRFPSGAEGSARCHMASDQMEMSLTVTCSHGRMRAANFVLPHLDDRLFITSRHGERVEHLGTTPTWNYQLAAFFRAVRNGEAMPTDAADGVRTMRLIDDCYDAIGLGPRPRSQIA